jgi:glycosyltransferase involved in cell wall biosynthesis
MLGWELPPQNSGGLGVACYQLSKALASYGVQIDFVLPSTDKPHPGVDFMNVLPVGPCDEHHKDVYKLSYANKDISSIRTIQADYKQFVEHYLKTHETPHIIHAHDWLTLDAGVHAKKISGVPLIAHVHATEFDRSGGGYGNPFIHEVEQHGLMMADRIIAVSDYTKRLITQTYHIPAEKIDVVHNSFSLDELSPAERISYRYLDMLKKDGVSVIAAVGRLTLQKGLMQFLDAAAKAYYRYNRLAFVVAGSGEQRDELIARAAELGIADQVIFTGFVRGAAWRQLYEVADVFVMSSISEPFGITALEAAAHGTPVVMTHQSGVAEVLTHSLKYDYLNTDRLADIIVNIASSQGLRDAMVTNANQQLEHLSWNTMAERCLNVYHGVARSVAHA